MNLIPLLKQWKLLAAIWTPILLGLIPYFWKGGTTGKEQYAAYILLLMSIFWVLECVPLAITSFFPVLLFPIFGILSSDKISSIYLENSILFLMGGVILALAVEYSNLHTRIAIKVILLIGAKIPRLLLGMMLTTMILSMGMNNTSCTAMMIPIVNAILEQLKNEMLSQQASLNSNEDRETELEILGEHSRRLRRRRESLELFDEEKEKLRREEQVNERIRNLKIMFLLAIAYSSNIGGTGVITGSATNIIVVSLLRKEADQDFTQECKDYLHIGFLQWMLFNIPTCILNTVVSWAYLQIHFMGFPKIHWKFWTKKRCGGLEEKRMNDVLERNVTLAIREKYTQLGGIRFDEICVCIIFAFTVLLWILPLHKFPFFKEYGPRFIREASPTFLSCVILFLIPRRSEYFKNIKSGGLREGMNDTLLNWKFLQSKFPWGVFIMLGGGTAMAKGAKESGLNKWVSEALEGSDILKALPAPVLLILILVLVTIITTLASNTACAAIIIPVLLGLSYVKGLHPMYLVMPAATICSYAFMLPISTPPNAIAYGSSADLKVSDMLKAGFAINVLTTTILFFTTETLNTWIFQFDDYNGACSSKPISPVG